MRMILMVDTVFSYPGTDVCISYRPSAEETFANDVKYCIINVCCK